jgi:ABC-2 type transport system permease protein
MFDDILTVMWKERKGMANYQGSRFRMLLVMLTPVLFAVVFPLQVGPDWTWEAPAIILAAVIPALLIAVTIPESFAGEREKHTLGTLLASRLPDRAIFFGKLVNAVVFAWGITLLVLLISILVVNIANWEGSVIFYNLPIGLGSVAMSFLVSTTMAGAGVLISMRSETVQQAAQLLMAVLLVPAIVLQVGLFVLVDQLRDVIGAIDGAQMLIIILIGLAVIDAIVMAAALWRFQRARLTV